LAELERTMGDAGFWADAERARKAVEEVKQLKRWVDPYRALQKRVRDELELAELHEAEPVADATLEQLQQQNLSEFESEIEQLELQHMLQGPDDGRDALLTIHSGAGGTESQDWAEMLMRMYTRWAERRGFKPASSPPRSRSAGNTPTGSSRRRRGFTGWCESRRSTRSRAAIPRSHRCSSIPW